jgi:hypothetical protein
LVLYGDFKKPNPKCLKEAFPGHLQPFGLTTALLIEPAGLSTRPDKISRPEAERL